MNDKESAAFRTFIIMAQQILRSEVPENLTWDLTTIFESDDAFEVAFKSVQSAAKQLSQYIGHVGESATALLAALEADLAAEREFEKVYVYAHQIFDQDTTNPNMRLIMRRFRVYMRS